MYVYEKLFDRNNQFFVKCLFDIFKIIVGLIFFRICHTWRNLTNYLKSLDVLNFLLNFWNFFFIKVCINSNFFLFSIQNHSNKSNLKKFGQLLKKFGRFELFEEFLNFFFEQFDQYFFFRFSNNLVFNTIKTNHIWINLAN